MVVQHDEVAARAVRSVVGARRRARVLVAGVRVDPLVGLAGLGVLERVGRLLAILGVHLAADVGADGRAHGGADQGSDQAALGDDVAGRRADAGPGGRARLFMGRAARGERDSHRERYQELVHAVFRCSSCSSGVWRERSFVWKRSRRR